MAPAWRAAIGECSDEWLQRLAEFDAAAPDFSAEASGGRGGDYRTAQCDPQVRVRGITTLYQLLAGSKPATDLLDALGGDGLVARVLSRVALPSAANVLTSDLNSDMVQAALDYGLPAVQQAAQDLCLRDESVDAVLIAYGSHHIPPAFRLDTFREAFRVLRPGGKMILHDFEAGGPVARWFSEVVHPYSATGHDFLHYDRIELYDYLDAAGFSEGCVLDLYDPFELQATDEDAARRALGNYLVNMYGLVRLRAHGGEDAFNDAVALAEKIFRYDYTRMGLPKGFGCAALTIQTQADGVSISMPRVALAAVGTKPG